MRMKIVSVGVAVIVGVVGLAPQAVADSREVRTWAGAAAVAGPDGSLWQPTYRAGFKRSGPITVVQETYEGDTKAMAVFALFGDYTRGFRIYEKYQGYQLALDPEANRSAATVGTFTVRLGDPDTSIPIRARVLANCWEPGEVTNPTPAPDNFRCSKADVKKYGATLTMTARPPSTMTAPGNTDIIIQTRGISFRQLMRIASNLQQIMG